MLAHNTEAVQIRIQALKREMETLQRKLPPTAAKVVRKEKGSASRPRPRLGRVLARDVTITTILGSIYDAMAKVLAELGKLALHDHFFTQFQRNPTAAAAKALLRKIGVIRSEMFAHVRFDPDFQEHCRRQTLRYRNAAAKGDVKARGIIANRDIFDSRGRWIGDLNEAVSIYRGARTLQGVRKLKNVKTLNQAKLMFDEVMIDGEDRCFLYSQKHHRTFLRAVALAAK